MFRLFLLLLVLVPLSCLGMRHNPSEAEFQREASENREESSNIWVMRLRKHADPHVVAKKLGMRYLHAMPGLPDYHAFLARENTPQMIHDKLAAGEANPDILSHTRQIKRQKYIRSHEWKDLHEEIERVSGKIIMRKIRGDTKPSYWKNTSTDPDKDILVDRKEPENPKGSLRKTALKQVGKKKKSAVETRPTPHDDKMTKKKKKTLEVRRRVYRVVDPMYPRQWHLHGTPGVDVNAVEAWETGASGSGVVIGVVDDGLEHIHPDITPNYRSDLSWDWNDRDSDPAPSSSDNHGTSAAGVAAAHRNANCGVGGSPDANLAGLRLIAGPSSDYMEAMALSHKSNFIHIKTNSWGPYDDGRDLQGPGPLTRASMQHTAETGRGGKGGIYVWAGGNGAQANDNGNYDGYANGRFTIAVGALAHDQRRAYYSEPCACLMLVAPSSGTRGYGITTTDRVGRAGYGSGDCTDTFGGTSSAAPLVAGGIAAMLSINPELTRRDVLHILARTAKKVNPTDADWVTVDAENGIHHNHQYGWGVIDMGAAAAMARSWPSGRIPRERVCSTGRTATAVNIPDSGTEHVWTITLPTRMCIHTDGEAIDYVEYVTLNFEATHSLRGDLIVKLRSPDGVESILSEVHSDYNRNYPRGGWTFGSARHWGGGMHGQWQIRVSDGRQNNRMGRVTGFIINIYGHVKSDAVK